MSGPSHVPPSPPDPAPPTPNRRQFLLGAAGCAALAMPGGATARGAPRSTNAGPNWEQLGRALKGKLLRPGTDGYAQAIKIRNLRYAATRPAGVALAADAKDIATAIAWARDNRVEMVSRSGGHSYAGYSTTPGLVINLNGMTGVAVDRATGNMTITGAATNQDVEDAGKPLGRTIPGGQCPTVGVAGFVLGGGLGFSMRQYGLAIDSLLATEIVTADGTRRCVSRQEPCDLFWALCGGGGGNFGINTSFTFRTFVVPKRVTIFSLTWDGDACVRAFLAFQSVLLHAPDTLGAIAHFGARPDAAGAVRPYLRIFGQVVEAKQAADRLLAPVIAAARPGETLVEEKDFWAAKDWLGEGPGRPNAFSERSRFHPKPLPEAGVGALVDALAHAPIRGADQVVSSSFFAWGGAVARVAPEATAFVHRKDVWLQAISCSWGEADTGPTIDRLLTWQDSLYRAMGAYASDRAYQNFTDPQLERPLQAYYGDNLPCLVKVKREYDPSNVFTFAQSIRG